jgi:hypothetical protein
MADSIVFDCEQVVVYDGEAGKLVATVEMTYLHADGNQVAVGRERPNNVVPGKRLERGTTTYNFLL